MLFTGHKQYDLSAKTAQSLRDSLWTQPAVKITLNKAYQQEALNRPVPSPWEPMWRLGHRLYKRCVACREEGESCVL